MKILYIHQYFFTPEHDGRLRSYHFAKALVEQGHSVELITSHNLGKYQHQAIEGISVHYLPIFYDNKLNAWRRIWAFTRFVWQCYALASRLKVDICFATSTPLSVGFIALTLKYIKGVPYIFEVRDLWPEAPIQLGLFRHKLYQKILYGLEKRIYQQAEKIVALSPGMEEGVKKVVDTKPVVLIPNIADTSFFVPVYQKSEATLAKYNIENKLTISYIGTIGKANALQQLIDLALWWQNNTEVAVQFLIVGEGAERTRLESFVAVHKLKNIQFLGHKNRYEVRDLLAITDFSYISFGQQPILATNSPNKFFDSIAAGVPCIINIRGWIADELTQAHCGFYCSAQNPQYLFECIMQLMRQPATYTQMKVNARHLAETKFSKNKAVANMTALFE